MSDVIVNKCPKCRGEMDKGFLIARLFFWSKEPHSNINAYGSSHVFTKGVEVIAKGSFTSIANVEAYRCKKCKIVVFSYQGMDNE